ncbi:MAG: ribosome silencing factor [Xanthomonadaceae bacterium]|nr:ribosome silencing factor [Xanthomonadaceae bacterium]
MQNATMAREAQAVESTGLRDLCVDVLEDAKAQDIEVFDLRKRNTYADFMVLASGSSSRQVKAMAERLTLKVKQTGLAAPLGVEGQESGEWVLVDLADVVVHLMLPATRAFYNLEKLWSATTLQRPDPTIDSSADEPRDGLGDFADDDGVPNKTNRGSNEP